MVQAVRPQLSFGWLKGRLMRTMCVLTKSCCPSTLSHESIYLQAPASNKTARAI